MHFNHALIFASAPWATGDEAMALPYDARARKVTESLPPCPTGQRARLSQDLRLGDADRPRGRGEEEFDTTFNQSHQSRGRGLSVPTCPLACSSPCPSRAWQPRREASTSGALSSRVSRRPLQVGSQCPIGKGSCFLPNTLSRAPNWRDLVRVT